MKKLLIFLSFSMIALTNWSQISNACFSSRNDISFNKPYSGSRGIVKGDFDSDGILDVVLSNYISGTSKRFSFLKGLGDGKFAAAVSFGNSGNLPQDIRSADFNNDGKLDIALTNQTGIYIYHGQGNGVFDSITTLTFTNVKYIAVGDFNEDGAMDIVGATGPPSSQFTLFTGTLGNPTLFGSAAFTISNPIVNMEVADMDGDNHLDVVSYTSISTVHISKNNNGSLGNFFSGTAISSSGSGGTDLTLCDIDNDGDNDVITTNKTSNNISVLKNNGSGVLSSAIVYATESGPDGIDNFDINQDGFKDIVVANFSASTISIFYGSSGGALSLYQTTQAAGNPKALVIGHFNSDSYPDIVSAQNNGTYINSFIGNSTNNYLQTNLFDVGASPSSSFAGDFNNDGNQDVALTYSGSGTAQIYLGNGAGNFTAGATLTTGTTPVYITGADLDNSGSMDLVVVNNGSNNISVFYGTGSGTFSAGTNYSVGTTPVQAKIGNLNGDALADIVVTNSGSANFSVLTASSATSFNSAVNNTTNTTPYAIAIMDYDLDGINDIIIGHNAASSSLLLRFKGSGTGTFISGGNIGVANAYYNLVTCLEAADLDGNGLSDLIVGRSGVVGKIFNPAATTGSASTNETTIINNALGSGAVVGLKIVDVNNDGKLDVLAVYNNSTPTVVGTLVASVATAFGTNSGYVLTPPTVGFASELDGAGLAAADFNNDGRVDAVVPNKASNSFTLHLNTTPVITAGGPTTFCSGNSVTLNSTPATYWYEWDPNNETTQAISATATGPYYVVTSSSWSDWCQAKSDTITVTVTPGPTAPTITPGGSTTFCSGGNVVLTSSQTTGNQWYKDGVLITGATNQNYTATTAGIYTVTYTSGGCTSPQSSGITVTASETPIITAGGPTTFCTGGSVVLTSSVTTNILWSNGATTPSITVTTSGNYSVQNNVGGCPTLTSNTITVTVAASLSTPTISPAGPVTLCPSGTVTLTSSSATNNVWSTGATTQSITVNTAGSYFVHLDNGSCTSANSTAVTVTNGSAPAAPTITPGGPTTFCAGGSVTLTSSAGNSYLWSTGATTPSINVTTSGSYTVQVTNAAGCQSTASAPTVVTVNALPAAPTITPGGPTTFCAGGSVTLTSSAGNSYLWSTGATTPSINVTTAGSYTVQVTNAAGCQSTASTPTVITVNTAPSAPTITPGGSTTFCSGGSVTLTSSAGNSYLWSTGATTPSINVTTSGSYTVQVTNAAGCQSTASVPTVVTVNALPAAPTITPGGSTTFCAGGSVTLTSSAGNSYLWSTGAITPSINVTTSGSYTVQVTNAAGCQSTASAPTVVTVNALPAAPTITPGGPTTFCAGGSVTLTSSAGNSYLWSTGATTPSINVTTSGSYTVQVTNAAGCQSTASTPTVVTVNTAPSAPTITPGGSTAICAGGSVTLTSSAGNSYLWSTGATTPSINVTTAGSYTVQVTDAAGCQSTTSAPTVVTVNALPAAPTITPGGSTTFCSGGSVTLTSSAGNSYLWSTGATTPSINVTTSGSYTVQVTNAAGCQSTASAPTVVTVNALPVAPTITPGGPTTFCAGGSVTLTSSAGNSYLWSTGATTPSINVTTSGSYTVQVTNAAGCQSTASAPTVVTVNTAPSAPTITPGGSTTFCSGGSVTLTSSAGNSYLWSTGATTPSINVTTSGSYTVQVTNAAGCQSTASAPTVVTVNALPAAPTITPGGSTTFCAGGSVTLTSSAGNSYLWSTGAITPSINVTTSGSYTVQVTNAAGCQSTASAPTVVTVNALPAAPTITPGGPTTFCAGGSVTLTSSAGNSYLWSTGATTPSINVTTAGSYTVQVTNAAGCQSTASAPTVVTVNALPATPTITAGGSTNICMGHTVTLTSSTGTSYLWSTGETTQSITVGTSGSYTVQVTNAAGCLSNPSAPTTVTVNVTVATPSILTSGPTTFCEGGSVTLTCSTGFFFLWSNGVTTQSINVDTSGTFTVQRLNFSGCQSNPSAPVTVTVNPLPAAPVITAGGPTTFCAGGSVTLTSSAGASYLWSTGETTPSIDVTTAGAYSVQITDVNGCQSDASAATNITVNPNPSIPVITASGPTTFCDGGSVVLTSSSASGNLWSTGETTQSITVTTSGSYSVDVTNGFGCTTSSATTNVTVNPNPPIPIITAGGPTTFCDGSSVILTSSALSGNTWSTSETTQSITVTAPGSYSVTETNGFGCSSSSIPTSITVNPIPAIPTITAGGSTTFCDGGSVVLTSSAASGNLWSTGETTQSITVTTSGSYTVEEIQAGCSSGPSASETITVNPNPSVPTITPASSTTFCDGGSVVLTSSASTGNMWSTGETTQSITVTVSGSYSVDVTNGFGCTTSSGSPTIVTVNPIPPVPSITAGGPTTFCSGNAVVLTSSASTGNVWSTGETTQSITVSTSGSYTVEQILLGCSSGSSIQTDILVNPTPATPTITAGGPTTFCTGGSVVLTSTAGTAYLWSTGETTQSITVTASGSYSVTIIDGPCSSASSNVISVTVNPIPVAPTITAGGPTTFCTGGSVVLTSSSSTGNMWSTGATTQSITVSSSGTYTVNLTVLGCTSPNASQTITVNPIPAAPSVTAGGPTTFCAGSSVVLTSSASSGNTWSTTETTQSITVTASGSYTVTQTLLGCTSPASAPVNVIVNTIPSVPTITASGPTTFCAGGSVTLTSSSATNNFWSNGATTQSITVSSSGTFLVQVITNGCSSGTSAPKTVTVNPLPPAPTIVTGTTESICAGSSVTLTSSSTGGNVWSTGATTQSITVSTAGSYYVTVTDGNGCTSPASPTTVVTVNPLPAAPVISANGPTTFCSGGSVVLTSSYSSNNLWSSGSTANSITISSNGTYTVTHTDANGCVSPTSAPVTITVNSIPAAPVITASGPTSFCTGGSVILTSSQATGNSWSTAAMTQSITVTTAGVYSVIYIDGNGCASSSSAPVVVNVFSNPPAPSISAGGATTICQGSFVTLTSSYTSGNTWSTGGVTQNINATTSGAYTVTYTNANGCSTTSAPMNVTVIPVSSIPTISASGSTTICDGSSVTLTSSDPNSTWSTGATTQSIAVTTSGSYWVVGNQTGCPSQPSAPVVVNVNPSPAAPVITPSGPTTICEGEELFLFTSGSGTNTWSTGYIGQVLEVTASGNYWVTVQNVYGCTASSTVVPVVVNENPVVTINPFNPLCSYASPFTMSNGLPAGGTYTGTGITTNIFYPASAGVGSSIVTYTYVDVNDCSSFAQTTIEVNDCAGIDEKEKSYFSLFPNPNNGQFQVLSSGTPMDHIIIYDAQGKMVFNESYPGIFTLEFDLNAWSNGVYYIEINSDQEIQERIPLIINH
ncbi:FG-GAP-like repeat-containing protein [Fluviicola chungangensis]|nr:FG-GAP-like repeat-containing protein [Fluviicola chungangensis]